MDERIFKVKIGQPIPAWDANHRLSLAGAVGPELKDSATIHCVNSTYMDVSEQPHMMRHWVGGGVQTAIGSSALLVVFLFFIFFSSSQPKWDFGLYLLIFVLVTGVFGFGYTACKFGRDEMFSLTRRPIRFNRIEKKIYAVRRRRFFSAAALGDITWEIPWNNDAFFCIHRGPQNTEHDESYHIRCYQLDAAGNVLRGFGIGREWQELDGMNDLLCQWNYWCWYMNHGPAELPPPLLFLTEREGLFESFLYCMYEVGFGVSAKLRIALLPYFAWLTIHRVLALWTCRAPIWPPHVAKVSHIDKDDPYQQPVGDTPVGWAKTSQALKANSYPSDPRRKMPDWRGEEDGFKNAKRWQAEIAPGNS